MSSVSRETSATIWGASRNLLTDAEITEDHVEQICDVDGTSGPTEAA
jgi:hypothetical protein